MSIRLIKVNTATATAKLARDGVNIALARATTGTLWAAYIDNDSSPNQDIFVAYSTNGGQTWTEESALVDGRVAIGSPANGGKTIALMLDSNNVPHIVFLGLNAADTGIGRIRYFKVSYNF